MCTNYNDCVQKRWYNSSQHGPLGAGLESVPSKSTKSYELRLTSRCQANCARNDFDARTIVQTRRTKTDDVSDFIFYLCYRDHNWARNWATQWTKQCLVNENIEHCVLLIFVQCFILHCWTKTWYSCCYDEFWISCWVSVSL